MDWKIYEVEHGIYRIQFKKSSVHVYLIRGSKLGLLIDTGCGGKGLRSFIEQQFTIPCIVVNSHGHFDHIGCNGEFREIYIHEDDLNTLKNHSDSRYIRQFMRILNPASVVLYQQLTRFRMFHPSICYHMIPIQDGYIFNLGNRRIKVIHIPGHSAGSIALYDECSNVLFAGDSICEKLVLLGLPDSCAVHIYHDSIKKLDELLSEDVHIYSNHHTPLVNKQLLKDYLACAKLIINSPQEYKEKSLAGARFLYQEYGRAKITYDVENI